MSQQDAFVNGGTGLWAQQMDRWVESATRCQTQMETFAGLWVTQITEVQRESQKFLEEWVASVTKTQAGLWKAWEVPVKEGAQVLDGCSAPR